MWEDSDYCWIVLCKNRLFHFRKHLFSSHRIPLGETDAVSSPPNLSGPFQVRCDDCGAAYLYKPADIRRYEQELPESFVPHPLFRPGGDRRRSGRSRNQIRLLVRGDSAPAGEFEEKTYAISMSAHGALIGLSADVEVGQRLRLTEPRTHKELEGTVVRIRVPEGGRAEVAVEFLQPWPEVSPRKSEVAREAPDQRQAS